ncbi:hypothetical protein [Salinisphaera orenii]|uniref:hypothetical protein n=1 Tax=Salinisphaera orenii TaxID=856731 RepID=UPI0013A63F9A
MATIAIRADGFVEGACSTETVDARLWRQTMERQGLRIERRPCEDARALLFTRLIQPKTVSLEV